MNGAGGADQQNKNSGSTATRQNRRRQTKSNKFYSLSVGGEHIQSFDRKIFDGEWVYDPQRSNIRQLLDIVDDEVAT